jgi:HlyD family secretion protein
MKRAVVFLLLLVAAVALTACPERQELRYQGWVEANFIFVGPDETGRIETLSVREGDTVAAGAPVFTLDAELQRADVGVTEAHVANTRQAFERAQQLLRASAGTQKAFDDAQAALREAEARLNASQTRLARRQVTSPVAGTVQQIYYRVGEMVTAGRPVVALLPPANVKLRFFVPEAVLPQIKLGDRIAVQCDGCPKELSARISFIAHTAEYTPPVIYSLEERSKLVYMIEARPDRPEQLRVGQPVSIALAEPAS